MKTIDTDICVIGAGSGGLSVAAGAVQLGARVVLIEAQRMGGDCLNTGCVPSKAMLAAGHVAATMRGAGRFGIDAVEPVVRFDAVQDHVHGVIAAIAPHDSVERFTRLGCTVIEARAKFVGPMEVEAGDARVRARRFVLATGSRAAIPPIAGLAETPYFTNETIFENRSRPDHLVIIGAGPIGCEMAQAHRRLGARVTVLDQAGLLPKDDPELVAVVKARLVAEGIVFRLGVKVARVERSAAGIAATIEDGGVVQRIEGSHLLVAAGRRANIDDIGLDLAGVETTKAGAVVDARLRTTNKKIYAIGDVAGPYQFTHLANYHAGIVIRNALFRLPTRVDLAALPWVTYTDPELAQVGLSEAAARDRNPVVARFTFAENDRAQAERATEGFIKVVATRRGRVLGAAIVGARAGELIQPWVLAIKAGIKLSTMASMIAPYPTLGEVSKRAAGAFFTPKLFSERTRKLVRFLLRFG
ncbi:MAG: FAD-dependent oxidoreductase [Alphaproteobacteria bacterium]|nr:FAD-dependent oxidoreductase [Alphaproteobacteria bacterium]